MTYTVTTLTPTDVFGPLSLGNRAKTSRTVATLEDAERYIFETFNLRIELPEGADWEGTIGPSNTATTIEVREDNR